MIKQGLIFLFIFLLVLPIVNSSSLEVFDGGENNNYVDITLPISVNYTTLNIFANASEHWITQLGSLDNTTQITLVGTLTGLNVSGKGSFGTVNRAVFGDDASGKSGYFEDASGYIDVLDGTYFMDFFNGARSIRIMPFNYAMELDDFGIGNKVVRLIDTLSAGFFDDGTSKGLRLADGTYAINIDTGNLTMDYDGDLYTAGSVDTPSLFNSAGDLKLEPDAQGNVVLFGDTDVGNDEDGMRLIVSRKAPEGDSTFELFINKNEYANFLSSRALNFYSTGDYIFYSAKTKLFFWPQRTGSDAFNFRFQGGNNYATYGTYYDSNFAEITRFDADGNWTFNGTITSPIVDAGNFSILGEKGVTGNYSNGYCWNYFQGGILMHTNCTLV